MLRQQLCDVLEGLAGVFVKGQANDDSSIVTLADFTPLKNPNASVDGKEPTPSGARPPLTKGLRGEVTPFGIMIVINLHFRITMGLLQKLKPKAIRLNLAGGQIISAIT
jgi:hypothetical protein